MSLLDAAHDLPPERYRIIAVHAAVVVDMDCPTHGDRHRLIVCEECETWDGATLDDEGCPTFVALAEALGQGDR